MKSKRSVGESFVFNGRKTMRERILSAALNLLNEGGRETVTTRAVEQLAGVQPPILYRLFADKDGLLKALSEHGFSLYLGQKRGMSFDDDPVEALRSGWDRHVQFGLRHPSLYVLMYVQPDSSPSPAAELSYAMLHEHMERVAAAGRLRVSEKFAVALFHSSAVGIVLTLLRSQQDSSDFEISGMARDNTLSMITGTASLLVDQDHVAAAASTLDAAIGSAYEFSPGELSLLKEWLRRIRSRAAKW